MSGRRIHKRFLSVLAVLFLVPSPTFVLGAEIDTEFTKYEGNEIANNPSAQYLLQQIEKSYQILEEIKAGNVGAALSEEQRFIEQQRQIAQQKLQEDLDRMNKKYEEYTPRNAYAKYVSGFPEEYHEFLWEHFDYMYSKVEIAREYRDKVLANGGSYSEAMDVFVQYAAITKAERNQFTEDMIDKYELYNKISNIDDFNDLPDETKIAFAEHMEGIGLGEYTFKPMYDKDPDEPITQVALPSSITIQDKVELSSSVTETVQEPEVFAISDSNDTEEQVFEMVVEESNQSELVSFQPESLTTMNFYGNNYEAFDVPLMNSVSEFTISAWVKPDYSTGSSEFTILSKENAFALTINKNLPDKVAKFSVFDGFKWTTVQSFSPIPEKWTHIAATLDDDKISIYINGNQEASSVIDGVPTVNPSGYVELQPIQSIDSDSMILYGAQQHTKHGETSTESFLSGSIDEVLIDNHKLDASNIRELAIQSQYFSANTL